ncbi:Nuclease S1 [Colletotrichum gloeosporioides]|uniref:Nuclease S1 n=1 Tax=Colletotrichum gloeosporioides TaxID=474922 RepID=A0A8H4FH62_COLGL|nr:Nuclease S1 [Colletotrichum gloeosporioides]KAF3802188.1 Nuclease S1 [Colletotrichum gloeosporioides]
MKLSSTVALLGASLPGAVAWGMLSLPLTVTAAGLGHITTAYIASHFVANTTEAFFQDLLRNDTEHYLAGVATWADTIRYTRWGHFTGPFHFIDAHDSPPDYCGIDFERDCKAEGCVVTALANYTTRSLDTKLSGWERNQAARFVVHFIGDIHQPLHNEDVARGGNGIHVKWYGTDFNLHHVWDSSIAEKLIGGARRRPYDNAKRWADELADEIKTGKFAAQKADWLKTLDFNDVKTTALAWAGEGNAFVCTHVFPEGPRAIAGQELGGEYFQKAAPVIELQVAKAGVRMAAWLDLIAAAYTQATTGTTKMDTAEGNKDGNTDVGGADMGSEEL